MSFGGEGRSRNGEGGALSILIVLGFVRTEEFNFRFSILYNYYDNWQYGAKFERTMKSGYACSGANFRMA